MRMTHLAVMVLGAGALAACSRIPPKPRPGEATHTIAPPYVIGLGEIMGLNQMRHQKLWYAGQARNWPLVAYEVDEMREGFQDAATYHDRHKGAPQPLSVMIPLFVDTPLADLDKAASARDPVAFDKAFDALTEGCNGCHRAAGFGFNVITRPTGLTYTNQKF